MRICQIIRRAFDGDSITICARNISCLLNNKGIKNILITTESNTNNFPCDINFIDSINGFSFEDSDIIFYHFFESSPLNKEVEILNVRKVLVYHNVTPARFFRGLSEATVLSCSNGVMDAQETLGHYNHAITLSTYSKCELVSYGWNENDISVIPLINVNANTRNSFTDRTKRKNKSSFNILFVGRIAPNKKIEDLLYAVFCINNNVKFDIALNLVGNKNCFELYTKSLESYADKLNIKNLINFIGPVNESDLDYYYRNADVYISLSEHEGFCIPIIEAMEYGVPVIAYASTAIPETMGEAGLLLEEKNYDVICDWINRIHNDNSFVDEILNKQFKRIKNIGLNSNSDDIIDVIKKVRNDHAILRSSQIVFEPVCEVEADEFADFINNISKDKMIVVYGAGKIGSKIMRRLLEKHKKELLCFCDNNKALNEDFPDVKCVSHGECLNNHLDSIFVISVQNGYVNVIKKLISGNVNPNYIYHYNNGRKQMEK